MVLRLLQNCQSSPSAPLIPTQACVMPHNEGHQSVPPSRPESGQCIWLFTLPERGDGQRYGSNGLAGTWRKLGNKEFWQ